MELNRRAFTIITKWSIWEYQDLCKFVIHALKPLRTNQDPAIFYAYTWVKKDENFIRHMIDDIRQRSLAKNNIPRLEVPDTAIDDLCKILKMRTDTDGTDFETFISLPDRNVRMLLDECIVVMLKGNNFAPLCLRHLFEIISIDTVKGVSIYIDRERSDKQSLFSMDITLEGTKQIRILSKWCVSNRLRMEDFIIEALRALAGIKERVIFKESAKFYFGEFIHAGRKFCWSEQGDELFISKIINAVSDHTPGEFLIHKGLGVLNGEYTEEALKLLKY